MRELQNEIERLLVLSGEDPMINVELLSPRIREFGEHTKVQGACAWPASSKMLLRN